MAVFCFIWQVGWYVTLHVSEVPVSVVEHFKRGAPLAAFSLLPHEQKVSVLWEMGVVKLSDQFFSGILNILFIADILLIGMRKKICL